MGGDEETQLGRRNDYGGTARAVELPGERIIEEGRSRKAAASAVGAGRRDTILAASGKCERIRLRPQPELAGVAIARLVARSAPGDLSQSPDRYILMFSDALFLAGTMESTARVTDNHGCRFFLCEA